MRTIALALVVVAVAACGLTQPGSSEVGVKRTPAAPTSTSIDPQQRALSQAIARSGAVVLPVYFVRKGELAVAVRRLPADVNVVRRAVDALVSGPTTAEQAAGLSTAVPSLSRVRTMRLEQGDVAVVDLTGSFAALGPSNSAELRLAQIVYTVTTFPVSVSFYIDGRPAKAIAGLVLPDRPLTRDDFAQVVPAVLVDSIGPGQAVTTGTVISGSTALRGTDLVVRLTDATGRVLYQGQGRSDDARGERHAFRVVSQFRRVAAGPGTVTVTAATPDGAPALVVSVPIQLR